MARKPWVWGPGLEACPCLRGLGREESASALPSRASTASHESDLGSLELRLRALLSGGWWAVVCAGPQKFQKELEACLELAREDVELSRLGSRRSSAFLERRSRATSAARPSHAYLFLEEGEEMAKKLTDCRRWLMQTFTAADESAAEGHEAASAGREWYAEHPPVQAARRTSQDIDDSMWAMIRDPEAARLLERSGSPGFDALAFSALPSVLGKPLQCLGYRIIKEGLLEALSNQGIVKKALEHKFDSCLVRFLGATDALYSSVPYHNSAHAADVMMTMEWILKSAYMRAQVSALDHLMVMVAAAIHDVGHPGRNNLFLIKTMHPLAINYNDKSVLENMHLAKSFEVMRQENETNWFRLLRRDHRPNDFDEGDSGHLQPGQDLQQYMRRGLIDMVLATDMARHADHVRKLELYAEDIREEREGEFLGELPKSSVLQRLSKHSLRQEALENKLLLLESTLHAADLSNPSRPHPIMLQWTARVLEEFWLQGDEERSLGLEISPMCDREVGNKSVAKGQIGFIDFVIKPFYSPLAEIIPEMGEAVDELAKNRTFWAQMEENKVLMEDIFASLP